MTTVRLVAYKVAGYPYISTVQTTQTMNSLSAFAKIKPATKKNEPETHTLNGHLSASLNDYVKASADIAEAEAVKAKAEVTLKEHGMKLMCKRVADGRKVESLLLTNTKSGLLYIVQDRFRMVTAESAVTVQAVLGEDAVKRSSEFSFNSEVLARHQDKIAKAIMELDIPDEDKAGLLIEKETYGYTFELNDIKTVAEKAKQTVESVFAIVQPVQQLKGQGKK